MRGRVVRVEWQPCESASNLDDPTCLQAGSFCSPTFDICKIYQHGGL